MVIGYLQSYFEGDEYEDHLAIGGAADEGNLAYDGMPDPCFHQTKYFFPELNQKLSNSMQLCKIKHKSISVMDQLITGHNFMCRHSSIIKLGIVNVEDTAYRHCDSSEKEELFI